MYDLHIDQSVLESLREFMGEEYPALLETYLADSEERLRLLRSAIHDADPQALGQAAHSFKGSCSNMGARDLAELCRQLETSARDGDLQHGAGLLRQIEKELSVVRVLFRAERRRCST